MCPAEGWQLNLAAESLQLADVRHRLATAFEVGVMGCGSCLQRLYSKLPLCCSVSCASPTPDVTAHLLSDATSVLFSRLMIAEAHINRMTALQKCVFVQVSISGEQKVFAYVPLQDHTSSGCHGQLQFHIEDLFGSRSLTSSCTVCQGLTVVL